MKKSNIIQKNLINVRKAKLSDFDFFYSIKSESSNITWGGFLEKPERNRLFKRYCEILMCATKSQLEPISTKVNENLPMLKQGKRSIYIIELGEIRVGYIYLDWINDKTFELAISVSENYTGKGIARTAIKKLMDYLRSIDSQTVFIAWIREDNIASLKTFKSVSFIETEEYKLHWIESLEKDVRMFKFINKGIELDG